jgi:Tfp pilus assembly protein PilO
LRSGWRALVKPLLALVVLNVMVFVAWTLPRIIQERSLASRAATLEQELSLERARVAEQRARLAVLEKNAADERRFLNEVVSARRAALVPMLQDLSRMAREHGLAPKSQGYSRQALKTAPLTAFKITLPVSGTYQQLARFVQSLERSRHFVTIDSISIAQRGADGAASLDIVLSAYFPRERDDEETAS